MTAAAIELPDAGPLLAAYRDALAEGRLSYQRCARCSNAWLPPRDACPACLSPEWAWEAASGRGRVLSWVVYHRAYHPAFAHRLPYNVAVVELDEGPRLVTNIIDVEGGEGLLIEMPVELQAEREGDVPVARFRRV
jgi:uncharacterized OB-fold protein